MDAKLFYSKFEPGLIYYIVEDATELSNIQTDHYRVMFEGSLYVASEEPIEIAGFQAFDPPPEPVEDPADVDDPQVPESEA